MENPPETPSGQDVGQPAEPQPTPAVPVVVATVVHLPSPSLDESLAALAALDYPDLRFVFFVVGGDTGDGDTEGRIREVLPEALVRPVAGNPGYGPTQNELARIVAGDNGLFLLVHDDVAPAPDALRVMVAEMFRSNAALVGPKLVDWDDPTLLQHVGLAVDRVGEVDPIVLPGERDQEQHDAVGDVFCVASACMLVRADVFRAVGGFSSDIAFGGEEMDLCWRIHMMAGRVMVVPSAVVRHRERFVERNDAVDLNHLRERHRVETVLTMTAPSRFVPVVALLVVLSLAELVLGARSGRWRRALTALGATFSTLLHVGRLRRRRRSVRSLRIVSDAELHDLQVQGSARVVSYLRQQRARNDRKRLENRIAAAERERTARTTWGLVAFLCVVFAIGSRKLVTSGVAFVGQFVPFTETWRSLGSAYRSGWWPGGFGSVSPAPTGSALVGVATFFSLGNPAAARTAAIVGLPIVGMIGMWRLSREVTGSARARAAGTLAFAVIPLPYESIATGRWSALACHAAAPWCLLAFSRANDMLTATASDVARRTVRLGIVIAVVGAFEPVFLAMVAVAAIAWMLVTGAANGIRSLHGLPGVVGASTIVAIALNFPWVGRYVVKDWWSLIAGADTGVGRGEGILRVLTFDFGRTTWAPAILVLYGVLVVAVVVSREERFVWAARATALVGVFAALAVAADSRAFGLHLPPAPALLAFVAAGLALGTVVLFEVVAVDLRGQRFGWRQPLAFLAALAVVVPVLPLLVNTADGRWNQPTSSLATLLEQLRKDPDEGDYRVLYLGNAEILPAAPRTMPAAEGKQRLAYAVTDDGPTTIFSQWAPERTRSVDALESALEHLASGDTPRVGRLIAPLGVRYIVVPRIDGARSTREAQLSLPDGLVASLRVQLDLRRQYESADLLIYENTAWVPTVAQQTASGAQASPTAALDELVVTDLRGATPAKSGFVPGRATQRLEVATGVVTVAVPPSARWSLSVDGRTLPSRPAFGAVTGFDVPVGVAADTRATLKFDRPILQVAQVAVQFGMWVLAVVFALNIRRRRINSVEPAARGSAS